MADDGKRWSRAPFQVVLCSVERSDTPLARDRSPGRGRRIHGGPFFPLFFRCFSESLFTYFLVRFWSHFRSLLASFFHVFFMLKIDVFFVNFGRLFRWILGVPTLENGALA